MSLLEILACPVCKVRVAPSGESLTCASCGTLYPVVGGVPVMLPDGSSPETVHEVELQVRTTYDPWVHRAILQSLLDDQIVLEVGAGNMALDDPNIIRMDVMLSPYVDLVADVHHLPFLPESLDFVFSLAVFEHLRNPFQAADSIYEALKDGGYIYHECNFVMPYHGYPHHYFNASLQGLEQLFERFTPLRKGVAPYQMPSFALETVLRAYLRHSQLDQTRHGRRFAALLQLILSHDLTEYDVYLDEEAALNLAAGTYYAGRKEGAPGASLIPEVLHYLWENTAELRDRFPDIHQLASTDNILIWAKGEGREQYPEVADLLEKVRPYNKCGEAAEWDRSALQALPHIDPKYSTIEYGAAPPVHHTGRTQQERFTVWGTPDEPKGAKLVQRGAAILREEGLGMFLARLSQYLLTGPPR